MSVQLAGARLRRDGRIGGQRAFAAISCMLPQSPADSLRRELQIFANASHRLTAVKPMNNLMTLFRGHADFSFDGVFDFVFVSVLVLVSVSQSGKQACRKSVVSAVTCVL